MTTESHTILNEDIYAMAVAKWGADKLSAKAVIVLSSFCTTLARHFRGTNDRYQVIEGIAEAQVTCGQLQMIWPGTKKHIKVESSTAFIADLLSLLLRGLDGCELDEEVMAAAVHKTMQTCDVFENDFGSAAVDQCRKHKFRLLLEQIDEHSEVPA